MSREIKNTLILTVACFITIFPFHRSHGVLPFFLSPIIIKPTLLTIIPFLGIIIAFKIKKNKDVVNTITAILLTLLYWYAYFDLELNGTNDGLISITSSLILHGSVIYFLFNLIAGNKTRKTN